MKLPLHIVLPAVAVLTLPAVHAFSSHGLLFGAPHAKRAMRPLYYNEPPGNDKNMWSALANTERWISETLACNARIGPSGQVENPYTRKEVNYVCETSDEGAMIVAGIWRRLREARELGEQHGATQEENLLEQGETYSPRTMRQTQVVVLSSSDELSESFPVFDHLITVLNEARRNARDLVTDHSLEKLDEKMQHDDDEIGERDWVVSVNCAHLHPKFGTKSPKQVLEEMQKEDEEQEVDLNLQAYKERREAARRSPYPTLVIEVLSTPPPDYGNSPSPSNKKDEQVTSADVQRLEALFGKSAAMEKDDDNDNAFYQAIGQATGIDEISLVTPIILAQNWVAQHDDAFDVRTSAFTVTDATHVDAGYEFVFHNLAMLSGGRQGSSSSNNSNNRHYMVMSHFLSSSATSFEKFATQVNNMIQALPGMENKVEITTFHPEHIGAEKRAPVPIFCLEWRND